MSNIYLEAWHLTTWYSESIPTWPLTGLPVPLPWLVNGTKPTEKCRFFSGGLWDAWRAWGSRYAKVWCQTDNFTVETAGITLHGVCSNMFGGHKQAKCRITGVSYAVLLENHYDPYVHQWWVLVISAKNVGNARGAMAVMAVAWSHTLPSMIFSSPSCLAASCERKHSWRCSKTMSAHRFWNHICILHDYPSCFFKYPMFVLQFTYRRFGLHDCNC